MTAHRKREAPNGVEQLDGRPVVEEGYEFLLRLALSRAQEAPRELTRTATASCYLRRWAEMICMAAVQALAVSFLHGVPRNAEQWEGEVPTVGQVLGNISWNVQVKFRGCC
eukprot:gnl/MRDRNA2_/MRDRNA2_184124_c0_seq1.p2 gnl/MRDRNA2_/MRDRNA2_184124_c0~~gnl/MRDRNA2_/MRDRNA2_184124_c0_seq1.p2  ORF type:complete len:111 (+),score=13.99 gnl/MRDRNA2_/MRDRNA2_184124_c0_seq1:278-610(+)